MPFSPKQPLTHRTNSTLSTVQTQASSIHADNIMKSISTKQSQSPLYTSLPRIIGNNTTDSFTQHKLRSILARERNKTWSNVVFDDDETALTKEGMDEYIYDDPQGHTRYGGHDEDFTFWLDSIDLNDQASIAALAQQLKGTYINTCVYAPSYTIYTYVHTCTPIHSC